jgi:uncharacterized membrane protein YphA (DoxX/SURF4 family)
MAIWTNADRMLAARLAPILGAPVVRWIALLGLCAAYLQGGLNKFMDFPGAVTEMRHFGLSPPSLMAVLVILLELGASAMILTGFYRWLGAISLGAFTLAATFIANRFWEMAPPERFMAANGFFEHLGLVGGFLLVAWFDVCTKTRDNRYASEVP